ncbi:MOSC domain-containing protein [Proteiniborus sp.]|uniref:MOSC domain-containing protein n=1 Tax=Proteiniborus sp. TaxID=2079015 RepID=UPI003320A7B3
MKLDYEQNNFIGEVVAIHASHAKGVTPRLIEEGIFKEDYGLIGDKHSSSIDRQVSILAAESRSEIDSIKIDGFCANRFYENLTIKDLDTSKLTIGQEFIIGSVIFKITGLGKRCFPECNIVKRFGECSLKHGVVFAKVIKEGIVKVGDNLYLL